MANLSTSSVPSLPATDITCLKEQFTGFRTLPQEQVRMLISEAAGKSCQLDPIPTPIVLKLLDVLLPVITKLINLSFDTGRFAEAWKEALVLPSLKKPGLDFAFKNFRPVSNLSYISKLSERAGAEQFMEHLTANKLHSQLQSAKTQQHSTETSLLKVKNDMLMSMDEQHVTLLILLDLSAAFDTIHHDKLTGHLESDLGITDNALAWFKSYLSDRFHGLAPKCLCDLLTFKPSLYNLRSSGSILLSMPAVRSKTLGDRAFMVAAPTLWNSLPKELRAITNVNSFKAHIKTYLFRTLYW